MIGSKQINTNDIDFALKGSSQMQDFAFIFGQEPDALRGGFNRYQSFLGDLTGFNIWNYSLLDTEIKSMAMCNTWNTGNFVPWNKSQIANYNAITKPLNDTQSLCQRHERYFIYCLILITFSLKLKTKLAAK